MGKNRVMAAKNAKAKRERMKAIKWTTYTASMLEIHFGEIKVNSINDPLPRCGKSDNMHAYRVLFDGVRCARFRTMAELPILKKRIKTMGNYEFAQIVEIDGRDICIAV